MKISCKAQFRRATEIAYLDTAAEGLPLDESKDALLEYFADKSSGTPGRIRMFEVENNTVRAVASILGTSEKNVALVGNATEALNLLGNSIRWKSGDEVLITDLEFPSNVVCWLRLREQGVRVEVIPSRSGEIELHHFTSRLRPNTRVVSVSQVSYKTGTQVSFLAELSREVHRAGALLVVDATQALGRVPVGVEGVDFLVASSYKWLLGVHGLGVVYCAPHVLDELKPGAAGWYSVNDVFAPDRFERFALKEGAARFVGGMPNFSSIYVLHKSLTFLIQLGIRGIDAELKPLVQKAREGIAALGFQLLTPADPASSSGIVSFAYDAPEDLGQALRDVGVVVWAGDGRLRASVHIYNDEHDIDMLLASLAELPASALSDK
ncbi:MAG: aminotransferase class V-fold PLP-dependent enzyme [Acidobacteriaceae bacterium]